MISNAEDLIELLNQEFGTVGFTKVKDNWYLAREDCTQVVHLQKSAYGEQYYLNIGVLLKRLDDTQYPDEHKCHIRIRPHMLAAHQNIPQMIDFEDNSVHPQERMTLLSRVVKEVILPFLDDMADLRSIRVSLKSDKYPNLIITLKTREFLDRLIID